MNIKDLVEEAGYQPKRKASCHGGEYSSPCPFCKDGDDRFIIQPNRHNKNGDYNGGRYSCRVCGKYGDAITFLRDFRGIGYKEACSLLKITPKKKDQSTTIVYQPPVAEDPPRIWIEKAAAFVDWGHSKLMTNTEALAAMMKRGFSLDSIIRFKIGFNPGDARGFDFKRDRKDWGLEEQIKEDGKPRKLWLPVGFIIPSFSSEGHVVKVKIRRTNWKEGDNLPKYVEVSGSKLCPSVYGDTRLSIGLVLESEFDSLLVQQFASDLLYCIALGGSTKSPDRDTDNLIRRTKNMLFLPDFDKAGAVAWAKWQKMFPGIIRILTPHEKSVGDYAVVGGDVREWLRPCIQRLIA